MKTDQPNTAELEAMFVATDEAKCNRETAHTQGVYADHLVYIEERGRCRRGWTMITDGGSHRWYSHPVGSCIKMVQLGATLVDSMDDLPTSPKT